MSMIPYNMELFKDADLGTLQELEDLLNAIDDQILLDTLDKERKNGRDDYPNATMWRMYVSFYHFHCPSISAFKRELERNGQLREVCRMPIRYNKKGKRILSPPHSVFTRFEKRLRKHMTLVLSIFNNLTEEMTQSFDDFGKYLSLDGKIIEAYANKPSKKEKTDGRRDLDADYTVKEYTHTTDKGEVITKTYSFFGYRVHLIVDAKYELPVLFKVTPASEGEPTVAKELIKNLPLWLKEKAAFLMADRGYDGRPLQALIEANGIRPIIDIKNMWKGDTTRQYQETDFIYNYCGDVQYVKENGKVIKAQYAGYHKASDSLRYFTHPRDGAGYNEVYIKRSENPRIFNQVARDSYKFKRLYKMRTASERVNAHMDRDDQFETHYIRGLEKLTLRVTMSFIIRLGLKKVEIEKSHHNNQLVA